MDKSFVAHVHVYTGWNSISYYYTIITNAFIGTFICSFGINLVVCGGCDCGLLVMCYSIFIVMFNDFYRYHGVVTHTFVHF